MAIRPIRKRKRGGGRRREFPKRLRAYRERRPRKPLPRAAFPSFFTLLNLFSGFLAITQVHEGAFVYACWLIVLAGFFDALDGLMARLTDGVSLFGVELDSLCDVVSFGVAPAYLLYAFGLEQFGALGSIVASLPVLCGAVRLARFNVNFSGERKDYFSGLPIPVQAIAIVALILNIHETAWFSPASPDNLSLLIPLVVLLSLLMVSNVPFDTMPKPAPEYIRKHPYKVSAFLLGFLISVFIRPEGILVCFAVYILYGIGRAIHEIILAVRRTPIT